MSDESRFSVVNITTAIHMLVLSLWIPATLACAVTKIWTGDQRWATTAIVFFFGGLIAAVPIVYQSSKGDE